MHVPKLGLLGSVGTAFADARAVGASVVGACTFTAPETTIKLFAATALEGTASAGGTGPTSVAVYDGVTLLGAADIAGTAWSYDWTPGLTGEGEHTSLHAVASFAGAADATSADVGTVADVKLDFAALGTLRALWLPTHGVTVVSDKATAWVDCVAGYTLVQATPGAQLTYDATGWLGRPRLTAAGAQYMVCSHADWNTLFGGNDTDTVLVAATDAAATATVRHRVGLYGAAIADIASLAATASSELAYQRGSLTYNSGATPSGKRLDVVQNVGTTASAYVNGALVGAPATLNSDASSLSAVCIGVYYRYLTPTGLYFVGSLGPIALYNTVSDHAALAALVAAYGYANA